MTTPEPEQIDWEAANSILYCAIPDSFTVHGQFKLDLAAVAEALAAHRRLGIEQGKRMAGGWQDIATAPKDGTDIQARIPGNGQDNVIAWQDDAFRDSDDEPCGGWAFTTDQEPPDCWTDGVCWEVNEDGNASVQPTHWKPLTEQQEEG